MFIYSSCPLNRPTFWLFLFISQGLHIFDRCFLVEVPLNYQYQIFCSPPLKGWLRSPNAKQEGTISQMYLSYISFVGCP